MKFAIWLRRNWFVVSVIGAVVVAVVLRAPILAADPSDVVRSLGRDVAVVAIFVMIGMSLPTEEILPSLVRIRVHLLAQLFIFGIFPLMVLAVIAALGELFLTGAVIAGMCAVAVLPTTGSSCVVYTQAAHGNVVIATANAAISNTVGIVLSPLLLSLLLGAQGRAMDAQTFGGVVQGLVLRMLLPLIVGQVLRRLVHRVLADLSAALRDISSVGIVIVVFLSVSSALDNGFVEVMTGALGVGIALLLILHLLSVPLLWTIGRRSGLDYGDSVALVYVGSQKTLSLGAPLLSLYFADAPELLATALVPLIAFHIFQMIAGGFVRGWLLRREPASP